MWYPPPVVLPFVFESLSSIAYEDRSTTAMWPQVIPFDQYAYNAVNGIGKSEPKVGLALALLLDWGWSVVVSLRNLRILGHGFGYVTVLFTPQ